MVSTTKLRRWVQFVPAVAIPAICLWVLWPQLAGFSLSGFSGAIGQISALQWLLAVAATGLSFLALGQYDVIWHEILRTGVGRRRAARTGMAATAIGQTLGFGVLTAGFVRWRKLTGLAPATLAKLSLGVALSFMACWAGYAGLAAVGWYLGPVALAATCVGLAFLISARPGPLRDLPAGRMIFWTGADMAFAALALWVLMPEATTLPFASILALYILALGAGLISNAPGGLGGFDVVLLPVLAADVGLDAALATLLAFRAVYYLAPFTLAAISLVRAAPEDDPDRVLTRAQTRALLDQAPVTWGPCLQSARAMAVRGGHVMIARLPFLQVALGDAAGPADPKALEQTARRQGQIAAAYKVGPQSAANLRRVGWQVLCIAEDAVIDPANWTTAGRRRQSLRRKLRQAEAAGVRVERAGPQLPLGQLHAVQNEWSARNGFEMGLTMSRFDAETLAEQEVFLIWQGSTLKGFVSFHAAEEGWALDLIRAGDDLPDGAMHLAVVTAIDVAKAGGVRHLNLAAVPAGPKFWTRLSRSREGLAQFKGSFAPQWRPRYLAAPGPLQLAMAAVILTFHLQSVGARIQGRLNTFLQILGLQLPPLSPIAATTDKDDINGLASERAFPDALFARVDSR